MEGSDGGGEPPEEANSPSGRAEGGSGWRSVAGWRGVGVSRHDQKVKSGRSWQELNVEMELVRGDPLVSGLWP